MKHAYIFPGQGSQAPGMGKSLYESSIKARNLFEDANDILQFRITDIMFNGTEEELKETRITQPAIFIHSVILAACLQDFRPDMVGGHSLGEFSALTASGAMDFESGLRLVRIRAEEMQKCCESAPGAMAAIIGLEDGRIESICRDLGGTVVAANYNSDSQVVISGSWDEILEACAKMKEAGARRALPLQVGGAFHSSLMEPARAELAKAIETTTIKEPVCPVYQNVTARAEYTPEQIKANLLAQLTSPVRWTQSVKAMLRDGAGIFTEVGQGNVLQGLVKRIASAQGASVTLDGISGFFDS